MLSDRQTIRHQTLYCHFDRSEGEREKAPSCGTGSIGGEISGLRVSIEFKPFASIPACSFARDDSYGGLLLCHFDRSEAKWRNLPPVVRVPLGWEISRLRASIELEVFVSISTCSPARNDMEAGSLYSLGGDASTAFRMMPRRKAPRRLMSEV